MYHACVAPYKFISFCYTPIRWYLTTGICFINFSMIRAVTYRVPDYQRLSAETPTSLYVLRRGHRQL